MDRQIDSQTDTHQQFYNSLHRTVVQLYISLTFPKFLVYFFIFQDFSTFSISVTILFKLIKTFLSPITKNKKTPYFRQIHVVVNLTTFGI